LHSSKAFSISHSATPESRLGVGKRQAGDTAGTADQRENPYHVISRSAIKLQWNFSKVAVA